VLGDSVVKLMSTRLVYPAPASTRVYDDFFGTRVEFGAPSYDITYDRRLLTVPLLTANAQLVDVFAKRATAAPVRQGHDDTFVERVRGTIAECLAQTVPVVSIGEVSRRLQLTPRSLQRRLHEKQASFSALVDQARRELAQKLLAGEGTLLCEIAYRLGFSGVAPFFRAFRRWTGSSPREFQRHIAG
jgi:AraC-like DNA-binding protein